MGWSTDLRIRGTGFDSRLAHVIFGSLFGHVGDTFWTFVGHFLVIFGMSWDVFGSGLGVVSDGFGKMSEEVKQWVWEGNVRGGRKSSPAIRSGKLF